MKKVVRLTESDLTRIVKRVINEKKDMIRITGDYSGAKHVLGSSASPEDIMDEYNNAVEEGTPLVSYSDGVFYNQDGESVPLDVILDELNYAILGHEEEQLDWDEDDIWDGEDDSPKQKRFGDGNENEIYLTDNVRFHRKGDKLTLSYTPTKNMGGLTISDKQKKMLIDFLNKN
jgi:hypothetical protein